MTEGSIELKWEDKLLNQSTSNVQLFPKTVATSSLLSCLEQVGLYYHSLTNDRTQGILSSRQFFFPFLINTLCLKLNSTVYYGVYHASLVGVHISCSLSWVESFMVRIALFLLKMSRNILQPIADL